MKPNADYTDIEFSESEKLIIDQIYNEMYNAVRKVTVKYLSNIDLDDFDKVKSIEGLASSIEYPMLIFLAQGKLMDKLSETEYILTNILDNAIKNRLTKDLK